MCPHSLIRVSANYDIGGQEEGALTTTFMELSERSNTVTQEQIFVIERFIGLVCYRRFLNSIDSERMRNLEYLLHKNL